LQEVTSERKPRKSVSFSEGATVMDEDGTVMETPHVEKDTAEKHSTGKYFSFQSFLRPFNLISAFIRITITDFPFYPNQLRQTRK
jgi:hypothetical protein